MSASQVLSAWVQTTFSAMGARLFRNNVGMAWQGIVSKSTDREGKPLVIIRNPRHMPFGLIVPAKGKATSGGSDKIGWTPKLINAEHVGQTWAVFTAVEEKSLAYPKLTPDQKNFLDQVTLAGGLGFVARETADDPALIAWPEKKR